MSDQPAALRIALLQTGPRLGEVEANLAELHDGLRRCPDADLAVAPELAVHGYHLGRLGEPNEVEGLPADDDRVRELGRHGPTVVAGFIEAWRHHRYNSAAIVQADRVQVRRKLFLPNYRAWEERKHFRPGTRLRCVDLAAARIAVLICNDLWQPPLPWLAAHDGAEVLVVIANSVQSEAALPVQWAWDVLIRHAAVALQTFVVFVNRVGVEAGERFWGGSTVVGPDGAELIRLGADLDQALVEVDLAGLRRLRRAWPLLQESRFDIVASEAARRADEEE